MKILSVLVIAGTSLLLSSCAALRTPGEPVTLTNAVDASIDALEQAERRIVNRKGDSWDLWPADVTLTYHISDEKTRGVGATLAAPVGPASLGGEVSIAESTKRGNTIVMRFTKGGRQ